MQLFHVFPGHTDMKYIMILRLLVYDWFCIRCYLTKKKENLDVVLGQ